MNYTYDYGNNYNDLFNNVINGSSVAPGILIGLGIILLIIGLICLVLAVLTVIINWKLLKKMGNEGWKAIIPVYNTWSICEGIGLCPHWAWITVVSSVVLTQIPVLGGLVASAVSIYFAIIYYISMARSFGKDDGYAVLLFFFFPIVGFFLLKNEYVGAKPCHDLLFDDIIKSVQKDASTTSEAKVVSEEKKEG